MNEIVVTGDNIEVFIDKVVEAAKEGYVRLDTMELATAVVTNYWRCTMVKADSLNGEQEVEKSVTKAGRPPKVKE